ncbi:MAG: PDGLE domain-containing protein [Candidatus Omnitrophota bacterium]
MTKKDIILGLLIAAFLAIVISPFASSSPDGLEKVAEDKGFIEASEVEPIINSPIPDYAWPNMQSEKIATSIAGIVGVIIVFGLTYGLGAILKQRV